MRDYFVYILSNVSRTLYIGVTSNLETRIDAHKRKKNAGFTRDFNVTMLVYVESFANPADAIAREKQLKNWNRMKKIALIERANPEWKDLAGDWLSGDADANPMVWSAEM
jgi:putative endonuclease